MIFDETLHFRLRESYGTASFRREASYGFVIQDVGRLTCTWGPGRRRYWARRLLRKARRSPSE